MNAKKTSILLLSFLIFFQSHFTSVHLQCFTTSTLNSQLSTASLGQITSLSGINPLNCSKLDMNGTWSGGRLIYSDSPETPTSPGLLFQDQSLNATHPSLPNRLFVYHANGEVQTMRLSVLFSNRASVAANLTILQVGVAGPSSDYIYTGKTAFYRYLLSASSPSSSSRSTTVAPFSTVQFDAAFAQTDIQHLELLHGIWDYECDQPHAIKVCFHASGEEDPITYCSSLNVLPADATHQRGTFSHTNKLYSNNGGDASPVVLSSSSLFSFSIGCGSADDCSNGDEFVHGFDHSVTSSPPVPQSLKGNYGILYKIHINLINEGMNGMNVAMLVNPRGGEWGGAMFAEVGILPQEGENIFLIPPSNGYVNSNDEAAVAGSYSLPYNNVYDVWQQFMPTGGSAFPVLMLVTPWN